MVTKDLYQLFSIVSLPLTKLMCKLQSDGFSMQLQSLKTAAVEIPELKMLIHSLSLTLRTPSCTDGLTKFKALL